MPTAVHKMSSLRVRMTQKQTIVHRVAFQVPNRICKKRGRLGSNGRHSSRRGRSRLSEGARAPGACPSRLLEKNPLPPRRGRRPCRFRNRERGARPEGEGKGDPNGHIGAGGRTSTGGPGRADATTLHYDTTLRHYATTLRYDTTLRHYANCSVVSYTRDVNTTL